MRLSEDFFNRDTVKVARDLLGKFLVRRIGNKTISAMITETAGYPAAVLIRSINLSRGGGPGKLCQTMKIDRTLNGLMAGNKKLWVEDRKVQVSPVDIKIG